MGDIAYHYSLGEAGGCSRALDLTIKACGACSVCHLEDAGCGVLTYPSTTTGLAPPEPPCKRACVVAGEAANCGARIEWAGDFVYSHKADKCKLAHDLVVGECDFCEECTPKEAGCEEPFTSAVLKKFSFRPRANSYDQS